MAGRSARAGKLTGDRGVEGGRRISDANGSGRKLTGDRDVTGAWGEYDGPRGKSMGGKHDEATGAGRSRAPHSMRGHQGHHGVHETEKVTDHHRK